MTKFKMTIILERLNSLAPYFVTFSCQVLSIISVKMRRTVLLLSNYAHLGLGTQFRMKDIGFSGCNGLNSNLLVHELLLRHQ